MSKKVCHPQLAAIIIHEYDLHFGSLRFAICGFYQKASLELWKSTNMRKWITCIILIIISIIKLQGKFLCIVCVIGCGANGATQTGVLFGLFRILTLLHWWIFRHHCATVSWRHKLSAHRTLAPTWWDRRNEPYQGGCWCQLSCWMCIRRSGVSSGPVHRNLSSVCLNWSTEPPVTFLTSAGRTLHSIWSRKTRLVYRSLCSLHGACLDILVLKHSLPLQGCE